MIETLFIQARTKAGFESKVSAGEVKSDSIAFIEDTREIWTKGVYYPLSEIITVDSTPGESLLTCNLAGTTYKYKIGDECRFYDTDKQTYRFYKLLDIHENKAVWKPIEGTADLASSTLNGLMSKENFTKLEGIAAGAQVNVKPDWNAVSGNPAEILNKPTIPSKVSELNNDSNFINDSTSDGFTYGRIDGTWGKIRLVFNSISASSWVKDSTYADYEHKCDLACTGVTENDFAEVVFDVDEASSGNYAPVCDTQTDTVRIYSKVNDTIIIPTVVIIKK